MRGLCDARYEDTMGENRGSKGLIPFAPFELLL